MFSLKTVLSSALLASAAASDAYQTNYDVSRNGKTVKYVYQISAQGSHTPSMNQNINMTKNADDEPKQYNYVTPLGIRQQYMIGNELRYRYVEEQSGFMDELYNITQPFIQTSWNDTTILSAQAMMLGIYPPTKNNYVLEESQKYNAVPPIEGFDFKPWIDEMGLEALPHQTTIFPIQMNGWSYDYMLALDDTNCPYRGQMVNGIQKQMDDSAKEIIAANLQAMQQYVDKYGVNGFCSYVNWAYTESVDLKADIEKETPLDSMFSTCQKVQKNITEQIGNLENQSLGQVSSVEVRNHTRNQILKWISELPTTTPSQQAEINQMLAGVKLKTTAGSEHPRYVLFWTNEELLSQFALAFSNDPVVKNMLPLPPSSTILLEFTLDSSNALQVSGFINDQAVTLANCGDQTTCGARAFSDSIAQSLKISDVTSYCN